MADEPALRSYRLFLVVLLLVGGLIALGVGGYLLSRGYAFYAFLALCILGLFMLMIHGYRQDARERDR